MAWRSSGNSNDEMVDNLKRFNVITSSAVEAAFRAVDRQHFVPQNRIGQAHSDQPLKVENVHISAPHIYGTIVESLDLENGSPSSFLNIGSGTGYLSCIVSEVLGSDSYIFGVEIFPDVIDHCKASIERWHNSRKENLDCGTTRSTHDPMMQFVCGNGLEIDATKGECQFGFDRIYVGASVSRSHLKKVAELLRPGGILVGPVDGDLVKVVRLANTSETSQSEQEASEGEVYAGRFSRVSCVGIPQLSYDFTLHVVSEVRFAPLLRNPTAKTVIPSVVWDPSIHRSYPKHFKKAITEILLCSNAPSIQPIKVIPVAENVNLASQLPKDVWLKILSYTHRTWFDCPYKPDESFLRQKLRQEQETARHAKDACAEAERRLAQVEQERDSYKLLAMRCQLRLRALVKKRNKGSDNTNQTQTEHIRGEDDPFFDDVSGVAASLFFRRIVGNVNLSSILGSDAEDFEVDVESDQESVNLEGVNMEAESDDDSTSSEMEDSASAEEGSEDISIAASPDTSSSSFYNRISSNMESRTFFT